MYKRQGKVTVNNGTLDLASQNAANVILITKGSLANAGAKTTGNVEVAASAGAQCALNTINPVSYTHLDVYKRQVNTLHINRSARGGGDGGGV